VYACPLNVTFVPARLDIAGQVPVVVGNIVGVVPPPLPVWGVPLDVALGLALLVPRVLPPDDALLELLPAVGMTPDVPAMDDATFPDAPFWGPLPFEVPSPEVPDEEVDSCPGAPRPVTSVPHAIPGKGTARTMNARRGMLTRWRMGPSCP
jgi:hypothetical protein